MNFIVDDNNDIFLGGKKMFTLDEVEQHVNDNWITDLWENVYIGNNSPKLDGDPAYDVTEYQQTRTAESLLEDSDANLQLACKDYLKHLQKNGVEAV